MNIGQRQPLQNEVVQRVQKEVKAKHHLTTENCPWLNGTIESACKQIISDFVQCYQSLRCTQTSGPKWLTWFRAS
jgi:hypothetical protein